MEETFCQKPRLSDVVGLLADRLRVERDTVERYARNLRAACMLTRDVAGRGRRGGPPANSLDAATLLLAILATSHPFNAAPGVNQLALLECEGHGVLLDFLVALLDERCAGGPGLGLRSVRASLSPTIAVVEFDTETLIFHERDKPTLSPLPALSRALSPEIFVELGRFLGSRRASGSLPIPVETASHSVAAVL